MSTTKSIITGALIGGGVLAIVNAIIQNTKRKENSDQEFKWYQLLLFTLSGASIGAGIGYLYENSVKNRILEEKNFNENHLINEGVNQHDYKNVNPRYYNQAEKVVLFLNNHYKTKLAFEPGFSGSFSDKTAICSSDIDIKLEFKPNAFNSLEQMYYDVHNVLKNRYSQFSVRSQKVSSGLIFNINNTSYKIDVVPGRRFNNKSTAVNLFVKPSSYFDNSTRIQTNFQLREKSSSKKLSQIKLIQLLKIIKNENSIPIKSYHIDLMVQELFNKHYNDLPHKTVDKLVYTLDYISKNIHKNYVVPGNSNNLISSTLTYSEKCGIANEFGNIVLEYQKSPLSLKKYFPDTI